MIDRTDAGQATLLDFLMPLGIVMYSQEVTLRINVLLGSADDIHFGMATEKLDLPGKPLGKRHIVSVHPGDEIAPSLVQHFIKTSDKAGIRPAR